MSLNIKDEETDRLARELASRTGKSITRAVKDALRQALGLSDSNPVPVDRRRVSALQRRAVRDPGLADTTSGQLSDDLYDDAGMPR